jgi:hypothetical protein
VIVAWGSRFAGFVLYIKDAELCCEYVYSESLTHAIRAPFASSAGKATIELRFHRAGKNAGRVTLACAGRSVGSVDIPRRPALLGARQGRHLAIDHRVQRRALGIDAIGEVDCQEGQKWPLRAGQRISRRR